MAARGVATILVAHDRAVAQMAAQDEAYHPRRGLSCRGMSAPFHATLEAGEAVLRFPYDERLRMLLRAIPGRRWDPHERAWRVPLEPAPADALARLLAGLPGQPQVSDSLAREIERHRRRRRRGECVVERVRPDGEWWLGFPTDIHPELLAALLEHPRAYDVPTIGRAQIPLDELSARMLAQLSARHEALRLSEGARRALLVLRVEARREAADRRLEAEDRGDTPGLGEAERRRLGTRPHSAQPRHVTAALAEERPVPPTVLERSAIHEQPTFVLAPGHDPAQLQAFAMLPGATAPKPRGSAGRGPHGSVAHGPHGLAAQGPRGWVGHEHTLLPAIRADPFCVPALDAFLAEHGTWIDPLALELLQEIREEHARAAGLVALSAARDAPLEVPGLGGELKPFQRAGVNYLLAQRRAFLADEQGLGKTIEALAALEADGAYPAVVVCPASLKLNWLREIERWLPGRGVRVLMGTGKSLLPLAQITVVNYDILAARLDELRALAPRALVLDESHYCKNASAKRTQAVQRLAAAVPRDGLVLALTGTPVMNRPPELIPQLRILGRLEEFGSGVQFGRRFRGPDAHLRLHWHLRARCFVRRLKSEVLPQLPAKTRAVVPVELDNEAEYRLAERDLVAWLQSQPLDLRTLGAKVAAALRAERLVRLNALKLLAARGKLHGALAWIHDFLSSGERLVVFAHHREIQRAVLERFPTALHILGEDTPAAREAALRGFQAADGDANQLIVCSIDVAGQGLTLTRSSNVAFLELDWTPAKHDQAEDRCHRIGQQDAVNATYLLAADTVDETIATLLERKRAVIGAVTDGRSEDEEGVVDALVRSLRGAPHRHLRAVA
jgi:SWI/SNF-related matrix-associated actin-dependent regulator 1 of chromatin subfamily A